MTHDQADILSNDQELMEMVAELNRLRDLKDQLHNFRNDSPIAMLRYDVARKAWAKLFVRYDERLTELMR